MTYKNYQSKDQIYFLIPKKPFGQNLCKRYLNELKAEGYKRISYLDLSKKAIIFLQKQKIAQIIPIESDLLGRFVATVAQRLTCLRYVLESSEIDFELD